MHETPIAPQRKTSCPSWLFLAFCSGLKYIRLRIFVSFVFLWLIPSCGYGDPEFVPLRLNSIPWTDGESATYRITDSDGKIAGSMRIMLANDGEDKKRIERVVEGGMDEFVDVLVHTSNLRPIASTLVRTHSDGIETVNADYSGSGVALELTTKRNVTTVEHHSAPSNAYDYQSLLTVLRALPLKSGYGTRIDTFLPIAGFLDRVEVIASGPEDVDVPAGSYEAWRVLLRSRSSRSEAWIGTDAPHLLIKYIDGINGATFELQDVENP